jgi:hypothetical protein
MNKAVNKNIAMLLKKQGYNDPTLCYYFEDGEFKQNELGDITESDYGGGSLVENWNNKWLTKKNGDRCFGCSKDRGYSETFSAPTIIEAVMWIYEKYGIWIAVTQEIGATITYCYLVSGEHYSAVHKPYFKTPQEAYSTAIDYILKELI